MRSLSEQGIGKAPRHWRGAFFLQRKILTYVLRPSTSHGYSKGKISGIVSSDSRSRAVLGSNGHSDGDIGRIFGASDGSSTIRSKRHGKAATGQVTLNRIVEVRSIDSRNGIGKSKGRGSRLARSSDVGLIHSSESTRNIDLRGGRGGGSHHCQPRRHKWQPHQWEYHRPWLP